MKIYLMRHGDAESPATDPQCPLSPTGKMDIERVAANLSRYPLDITHIFHSEKLRAQQTAHIVATHLTLNGLMDVHSNMNPNDSVIPLADEINHSDTDLLFVGHMPFMGKLVSHLIMQNDQNEVILFRTGTIVCLERISHSTSWLIQWVINPDLC